MAACEKTVWHTEICFQIKLPLFNERFCIMFLIFYSLQEHLVPALRDRSQRQSSRPFKQKPQKSWRSCCSNRRLRPTIILFSSASVCHHCHSTKSIDFYCNGLVPFFWFFCKQSIVVIAYMCGVFYYRTITTWRYFWRHVFPEAQFIDNHSRDAAVTETRNCYTGYVQVVPSTFVIICMMLFRLCSGGMNATLLYCREPGACVMARPGGARQECSGAHE